MPVVTARAVGGSAESAVRRTVLRVVEEVLREGPVAAADSFYDFGGSSLQAMRVCVRLQKELGTEIEPTVLLDSDTIGDFADAVAELGGA